MNVESACSAKWRTFFQSIKKNRFSLDQGDGGLTCYNDHLEDNWGDENWKHPRDYNTYHDITMYNYWKFQELVYYYTLLNEKDIFHKGNRTHVTGKVIKVKSPTDGSTIKIKFGNPFCNTREYVFHNPNTG